MHTPGPLRRCKHVLWGRAPRAALRRVALNTVLAVAVVFTSSCGGSGSGRVRVIIPRGATFRAATDSLARAGLIRWPGVFRAYARLTSNDRGIKAGTYIFERGASWNQLVRALAGGEGIVATVTIPEGFALSQIIPLLSRTLEVPAESVEVVIRDSALRAHVGAPTPTLEGYLFPDTYSFPAGTSARAAVTELVKRFDRAWKPEWTAHIDSLRRRRHDVVTMASIVEKEAKVPQERPVIAGVYYNRLAINMLLQADPTVQYALPKHVERVLYKDLEIESKYNTYKHRGLPPGPIASPGAASLEAAVYPAQVSYLYFVAAPDGHHEFRNTLKEHDEARRVVRAQARGDSARLDTTKKSSTVKPSSKKKRS
jgi:UPF0755 protein